MGKNNVKPRTKFERWIRQNGGTKGVANALGVSQKGVQHWISGYCKPRAEIAYRILKLSKGQLTFSEIVNSRKGL